MRPRLASRLHGNDPDCFCPAVAFRIGDAEPSKLRDHRLDLTGLRRAQGFHARAKQLLSPFPQHLELHLGSDSDQADLIAQVG